MKTILHIRGVTQLKPLYVERNYKLFYICHLIRNLSPGLVNMSRFIIHCYRTSSWFWGEDFCLPQIPIVINKFLDFPWKKKFIISITFHCAQPWRSSFLAFNREKLPLPLGGARTGFLGGWRKQQLLLFLSGCCGQPTPMLASWSTGDCRLLSAPKMHRLTSLNS